MKYMAALIVSLICLPGLADDMEQAVEDTKAAGIEAIEEVSEIDPAEFEVRIESDEEEERYYRRDRLVLSRWKDKPVFRLCKGDTTLGRVVVGKDYSPHILLESNLEFSVNLFVLEEGVWELSFYGTDPDFLETYIVTSESVRPVNAETYLLKLAEAQGSRAFFKSMGESLMDGWKSDEAAETE